MTIDIRMPALSPTMEEGTLARWLVQVGDKVRSGDLIAEIETDKATMEFEAVDEGEVLSLLIAAGTEGVKVGTIIARISGESEDSTLCGSPSGNATALSSDRSLHAAGPSIDGPAARRRGADTTPRIKASPLARRIAAAKRIELAGIEGTGPDGRIRKADIEALLRLRPADIAELAAVAGVTELTTETSAPASPVSPLNSAQGGPPIQS